MRYEKLEGKNPSNQSALHWTKYKNYLIDHTYVIAIYKSIVHLQYIIVVYNVCMCVHMYICTYMRVYLIDLET